MKTRKVFIGLFFLSFIVACSSEQETSKIEQQQQSQEQFISENLQEVAQEPEFIIEVEYDEDLVEKAAKNKENKEESTKPIQLTSDDDDLNEDLNDIPSEVSVPSRSIAAYDYETLDVIEFDESKNKAKGFRSKEKTKKSNSQKELFYVVAGAYRTEKDANEKLKEIKDLGYQVELITFDDNFKTVCIAKLERVKQANILIKELKKNKIQASVVKRRVEE